MQLTSKLVVACALLIAHTHGRDGQSEKQLEEQRIQTDPDETSHLQLPGEAPEAAGGESRCASRSAGQRVVSMADQHGDFDAMASHLHKLGLLSRVPSKSPSSWSGLWAGGDAIFVQTGDILDRGPDGKVMYKLLWALQDQAPEGSVVLLTGNHELMALQGDIRYVTNIDFCAYTEDNCGGTLPSSTQYCDTCCNYQNRQCDSDGGDGCFKGNCEFLRSWDQHGEMGAEMRERFRQGKMKLVYEVNGVVFTHAGLASSIWDKIGSRGHGSIDVLNNRTAELFSSSDGQSLQYSTDIVAASAEQDGPMWSRICYDDWYTGYLDSDERGRVEGSRCATIAKSLQLLGAKRMVIGHCPQGPSSGSAGIRTICAGQFIEADTYMSIAYAKSRSAAIHNMAALEFYSKDPAAKVWVVYAGQNRCQELAEVGSAPAPAPTERRDET